MQDFDYLILGSTLSYIKMLRPQWLVSPGRRKRKLSIAGHFQQALKNYSTKIEGIEVKPIVNQLNKIS